MALRVVLIGNVGLEGDRQVGGEATLGRLARVGLAYLVFQRHRPVSRDELAEALWGEALPGSWEQMVRGVISGLRALLRDCGLEATTVLATVHGCYQIRLPADATVDIEVAAGTLTAARADLAAGNAESAQREAAEVVAIASRQFLPGASGLWVERRQAEARELHLGGLDILARAAEAQQRWAEVIAAAEEAVAIEPFRESAYLRLMAAHAGRGERGEALRAYERCRRVLSDELGMSPSAVTESAYVALLGDEPEPARAEQPVASVPLPSPLIPAPGSFFVGRVEVLERLVEAFERSTADKGRAVFVGGEPGAGKTALVAATAREAQARGARVLYGRCDEGLSVAYEPFAQAFGQLVSALALADLATHVATFGGELTRLTPELARRLPETAPPALSDPEADRYRLFEAAAGLVAAASASRSVVLVLDDLHWSAGATVLLLRRLLQSGGPPGLLVLGTYRHSELSHDHPLAAALADLRREPGVERLVLEGLDEDGVAAFMRAAGGPSLDEEAGVARAVHAHTAGNPFFVGELLRHLAESGAVYRRDAGWSYWADAGGRGVPDGVREVVARRLSRLSAVANRALVWAAVVGAEFDLDVVERVVEPGDADSVLDAVEEAMRGHLVAETKPGRYRFAHALVRDTIYTGITATRRARLHRRVGETLEALPGADTRVAALAHHFAEAAAAGGATKAADYALAAARLAWASAAWGDAVALLERGLAAVELDEPADPERRCDLLLLLAETWARFFNPTRSLEVAERAVEAARQVASVERLGAATYWYVAAAGRFFGRPDIEATAETMAGEALAALGDSMPSWSARILARNVLRHGGGAENTLRSALAALAMARASCDPDAVGVALMGMAAVLNGSTRPDEFLAVAEELVTAAPPGGWDGWRDGLSHRAMARLILGDRDGFEADVAACQRFGIERGFWHFVWISRMWQATLALLDGRFGEVEQLAASAADLSHHPVAAQYAVVEQLFQLRFDLGDFPPALQLVTRANEEYNLGSFAARRALVLAELDPQDSRLELERFVDEGPDDALLPVQPVFGLALRAQVAAALGFGSRAAALYAAYLPWAGQVVLGFAAPSGAVDRYLGMLATEIGQFEAAETHFDVALGLESGLRAPPLVARTRYWYGRMLLGRGGAGDDEKAARLLVASRETAVRLGMVRLAEQVDELLAAT